jgi:hypothetical protein
MSGDVRFGSLADIGEWIRDVRFAFESGHVQCRNRCLLCAKSRLADLLLFFVHLNDGGPFVALGLRGVSLAAGPVKAARTVIDKVLGDCFEQAGGA